MKVSKRILLCVAAIVLMLTVGALEGCSSCDRFNKSMASDFGGGLERTVIVYDYNGGVIEHWHGTFDLEENDQEIYFDFNDQRTIIQGGIVIVQEESQEAYEARGLD